jgi:hypothetical protein
MLDATVGAPVQRRATGATTRRCSMHRSASLDGYPASRLPMPG